MPRPPRAERARAAGQRSELPGELDRAQDRRVRPVDPDPLEGLAQHAPVEARVVGHERSPSSSRATSGSTSSGGGAPSTIAWVIPVKRWMPRDSGRSGRTSESNVSCSSPPPTSTAPPRSARRGRRRGRWSRCRGRGTPRSATGCSSKSTEADATARTRRMESARQGRSRPPARLASLAWPAPAPSSPAPPAGTRAPSGMAAAPAAASGTRSSRSSARPRPRGRPRRSGKAVRPVTLAEVEAQAVARLGTGIGELDRVLGGGLVPGSLVLIGGSPGIGKSTLTSAALGNMAGAGQERALRVGRGVGRPGQAARRAARAARARACRSWPRPTSTAWSPRSRPSARTSA